jgi:hypothetical protein
VQLKGNKVVGVTYILDVVTCSTILINYMVMYACYHVKTPELSLILVGISVGPCLSAYLSGEGAIMDTFTALWWREETHKGCNIGLVTNQLTSIHFCC